MERQGQNIQDSFLNTARKEKTVVTIVLVNGAKLVGRIRGFDRYSVIVESDRQEQLVFKHAISMVTQPRHAGFAVSAMAGTGTSED